jgi:type I restriction-modification system DNA methylase subunit
MQEIIKELEKIQAKGYDAHRVFCDWIDLMLYAFLADEEFYLTVVKRYNNSGSVGNREIDHFRNACHLLMSKMKQTNDEMLGEIYMQWNLSNKYTGQYFTPKVIAQFMSQLLNPEFGEVITDPCCGAGIMLVEACKLINFEELKNTWFIAQDINHTCVKMCALNMLFFNLNSYVILGNTLAFECQKVYQTSRSVLGGSIRELSAEEVEEMKPLIIRKVQENASKQIALF